MGTLLTDSIDNCGLISGQLKRLFVANWLDLKGKLIVSDGIITDINESLGWFEIDVIKNRAEASEKSEYRREGLRYSQQISLTIIEVENSRQERFKELVRGRFLCLFQDTTNKWFLIGRLGAEVKGYDSKIGGNDNNYNFSFVADDVIPKREVSNDYYENNIKFGTCSDSGIYTDDVTTLSVPMFQVLNCPVYP